MIKIAAWNVNSLRVRLNHLKDWLTLEQPDILALQETKLEDPYFPIMELAEAGYQAIYRGQKTYNGVAILSRIPGQLLNDHIPGYDDPQRRLLTVHYGELVVVNVYVPNGASLDSDKYQYKLDWLSHFNTYIRALMADHSKILILGDFNIAPEDRDVHDPKLWEGSVLTSPTERALLIQLLECGFTDAFRLFDQAPASFSWWDYRGGSFRRNHGLRIDLILLSQSLRSACAGCRIDREPRKREQPSDHAPVLAEFDNTKIKLV